MPNQYVDQRLAGIQTILNGVHQAGVGMSSNSIGSERQAFIQDFLANVLPPSYRFGSGDATDATGLRSGQLDVVIEHPFAPSLPGVGSGSTRLYLAECIAAVVEVKSNVASQWGQALHTAAALKPLRRQYQSSMVMGMPPSPDIPFFVAGYTGWATLATVQSNLASAPNVDGVLIIDKGIFVASPRYGGLVGSGPMALWAFISLLHAITNSLQAASTNPLAYG